MIFGCCEISMLRGLRHEPELLWGLQRRETFPISNQSAVNVKIIGTQARQTLRLQLLYEKGKVGAALTGKNHRVAVKRHEDGTVLSESVDEFSSSLHSLRPKIPVKYEDWNEISQTLLSCLQKRSSERKN